MISHYKKRMIHLSVVLFFSLLVIGTVLTYNTDDALILSNSLSAISSVPRGVGLEGETAQINSLASRMRGYGYQVTLDSYEGNTRMGEPFTSANLIAKKPCSKKNAGILVVSAHLDSIASTTGANDDASGVAVLETVAKKLRNKKSNLEIWYIAFTGEEEGLLGSTHFTASLDDATKSRIIGDIQLDMLGNAYSDGYEINTVNGQDNQLTMSFSKSIEGITGQKTSTSLEKSSDHVAFAMAQIPSVLFTQHGDGYENHLILDNNSIIDSSKLLDAETIVKHVLTEMMSRDSKELLAASTNEKKKMTGFLSPYEEIIDLDTSLLGMQETLGTSFTLIDTKEDELLGEIKTYTANVDWFDLGTAFPTTLTFTDDNLENIQVAGAETGYDADAMSFLLTKISGAPSADGSHYFWGNLLTRTGYEMEVGTDGSYILSITPYTEGDTELLHVPLDEDGNPAITINDTQQKIWDDMISKIVQTKDRQHFLKELVFFTDGLHYKLGYTVPAEPDEKETALWLDYNDVIDRSGNYRHYEKSVATIIHEYGHVLSLNETQVDVSANGPSNSVTLPPYKEDSYMAAFMNAFYSDQDVNDNLANENHSYRMHPDEYVSLYASDKTMEDFAESFMCFVLSEKPSGHSIAEHKILFFYHYPKMVAVRDAIRANFPWIEDGVTP